MITSKVEAPARLKHAGGETSIFWWLNSENVIPQRSFLSAVLNLMNTPCCV